MGSVLKAILVSRKLLTSCKNRDTLAEAARIVGTCLFSRLPRDVLQHMCLAHADRSCYQHHRTIARLLHAVKVRQKLVDHRLAPHIVLVLCEENENTH